MDYLFYYLVNSHKGPQSVFVLTYLIRNFCHWEYLRFQNIYSLLQILMRCYPGNYKNSTLVVNFRGIFCLLVINTRTKFWWILIHMETVKHIIDTNNYKILNTINRTYVHLIKLQNPPQQSSIENSSQLTILLPDICVRQ